MVKAKLLIVDDNADIVRLMAKRLNSLGYDVVTAADGDEVLDVALSEKPDLILMDVMMPGLDGISAGRRLKANPDTRKIPIIMVTAKGEREDMMKAIQEAEAAEYIVKPFIVDQLLEKIDYVLTHYPKNNLS